MNLPQVTGPDKVKLGDIVEFALDGGYAYAQYTNRHKQYGALLRVFEGVAASPRESFESLSADVVQFATFFPLQAAVDAGLAKIVSNQRIPESLMKFPTFRAGTVNPATNRVDVWWLWDGEREWRGGQLSPEQRRLPIRGVINDTLLKERIVAKWTPESDLR